MVKICILFKLILKVILILLDYKFVDLISIAEEAIQNQNTLLVVAAGTVKFDKKPSQPFCQNFLVTAVGTKWKVVSDCLRFQ